MRAVAVTEFGGPEALHVVELPDPEPGPGEVRIRVHAATVNPTDTGLRAGLRARRGGELPPPPYVPGMDVAGVLDAVGDGVDTELRLGDHVMAVVLPRRTRGGYAELVCVPADSVVAVPAGVSDAAAATLPMNGLTARLALDLLDLEPGQVLGVTGAAGAVGGYAVELAKVEGLRVVADAAPADEALVRSLGADEVVGRGDDVAARLRAVVPTGVDGLVDAALLHERIVPAVRDGGRIASVRPFAGATARGIEPVLVLVSEYATARDRLDGLRRLVEEGRLTLRVAATYPAAAAAEAHRRLEAGGTRGRLVLEW